MDIYLYYVTGRPAGGFGNNFFLIKKRKKRTVVCVCASVCSSPQM